MVRIFYSILLIFSGYAYAGIADSDISYSFLGSKDFIKYGGNINEISKNWSSQKINKKEFFKKIKSSNLKIKEKNKKLNINYTTDFLLFKVNYKAGSKGNIFIDALSPGYLLLFDQNMELLDSYGLGEENKKYYPIFSVDDTKDNVFYILRKGSLRFDGTVKLIDDKEADSFNEFNHNILLVFIGSMFFLILYQMFHYFISRDSNFLVYVLFNTSYSLVILIFGLFFYRVSNSILIEEYLLDIAALTIIFSSVFARNFLSLNKYCSPKIYKGFIYGELFLSLLIFIHLFSFGIVKSIVAPCIDGFIALYIIFLVGNTFKIRKLNVLSNFYLISWIASFSGVFFLYAYEYFNLFGEYKIVRYSLLIGCSVEMIINSFGLAYKSKLNEKEKIEAKLEAREKKRYQTMIRILSHDIANPLASASMTVEYMESFPDAKERISNALKKIEGIITDVRSQEKVNANSNKSVMTQDAFDQLNEIFRTKLDVKKIKFQLLGKPTLMIPLNESVLVNNLLGNLVSNAVKFTQENGTISMKVFEDESNVKISIIDNGTGISPEILDKLMAGKEVSGGNALYANNEGTGFGTGIVRDLLNDYDGKMEIKTKYIEDFDKSDSGSTFTISLPKIS